jgi:hypothetical protein
MCSHGLFEIKGDDKFEPVFGVLIALMCRLMFGLSKVGRKMTILRRLIWSLTTLFPRTVIRVRVIHNLHCDAAQP